VLRWPSTLNTRDLGGYATGDGRTTKWGVFVRSDNLHRLTAEGIAALRDYGIRTIVDLRLPSEASDLPHAFQSGYDGVRYVSISMLGDDDGEIRKLDQAVGNRFDWTSMMLDHASANIAAVMRAIAHAPEGGVLFHCHAGKDRTGMTAMFVLTLANVSRDDVIADYALSDELMRPLYEELMAKYGANPLAVRRIENSMWCPPETMAQTLDYLDVKYGGARRYLLDAGVTADELDRIRARVLASAV
jgi:protein-tyrosine phosphatase